MALRCKWKWRFLYENEDVWTELLRSRYGNIEKIILEGNLVKGRRTWSIWWQDLVRLCNRATKDAISFIGNVICRLGDGKSIPFWSATWCGGEALKHNYPNLYSRRVNYWANGLLDKCSWGMESVRARWGLVNCYLDLLVTISRPIGGSCAKRRCIRLFWVEWR